MDFVGRWFLLCLAVFTPQVAPSLHSCLHLRSLCVHDRECERSLTNIEMGCNPSENVRNDSSSNYARDLAVVRTFFGKPEDCWCFEGLGSVQECERLRKVVWNNRCELHHRDSEVHDVLGSNGYENETLSKRTTRSPNSHRIERWKAELSGELSPISHVLPAISCNAALNNICLKHISCRELWRIFRESCIVDAQNQCQMTNRNDCWQSYEGISWTGLGNCSCADDNSDCHWIRLQTNYNKCIYEISTGTTHSPNGSVTESLSRPLTTTSRPFVSRYLPRGTAGDSDFSTMKVNKGVTSGSRSSELQKDPSVDDESRRRLQWERQNMQRQQDLEAQRRQDLETRRQVELEAQRQRVMQDQKERDAAALRQRELEAHRQRELLAQQQHELERQRQLAAEAQRQRTLEEQRQRKVEAQRQRELQAQAASIRARSSFTTAMTPGSTEYRNPTSAYRTSSWPDYLSSHQSSRETVHQSHQSRGTTNSSRKNPTLMTPSYHFSNTTVSDRYLYDYATASAPTTSTVSPTTSEARETSAPEPPIATASSIRAYTQLSQPPTSPMPSTTSATIGLPETVAATTKQTSTTSRPYRKPSPVISSKKPRPTQPAIRQKSSVLKEHLENYVISNTSWQATNKGSSTCVPTYETCEQNETCKWHLSEVRMKCRLDEECVREQCAAALRRFVRYVPKKTVESLMFCTCSFGDGACKHQQQWMYPRCLYSYSREKPRWTCTQTVKLCQSDSYCLRHLPSFNRSCTLATVTSDEGLSSECTSTDLIACRNSLLAVRATYLEMPCYCHVNDSKCLEHQNLLLPNNPCIEDVMDHYGNPHVGSKRLHFTTSASDVMREESITTSSATTAATEPDNAEQVLSTSGADDAQAVATNSTAVDTLPTLNTTTVDSSAENSSSVNQSTTLALRRTQFSKSVLGGKYVTQTPPPKEGGCVTRNIDGEWIRHYKGSLLRQYHDWSGRCSSWCVCTQNETLTCKELPCLPEGNCETPHTTIKFGEKLYIDGRGACMCQSSNLICDTNDESALLSLPPGLYITIGYSRAELKLIKENVPKLPLEKSGLVSPDVSVANDITSRILFALERIVPKDTLCRIVLLEDFKDASVILLQVQWYGINRFANETEPHWQIGKMEKKCSPFIQRLEQIFLLEQGDRYQLVLSTVKQFRMIDLLDGIPSSSSWRHGATSLLVFLTIFAYLSSA